MDSYFGPDTAAAHEAAGKERPLGGSSADYFWSPASSSVSPGTSGHSASQRASSSSRSSSTSATTADSKSAHHPAASFNLVPPTPRATPFQPQSQRNSSHPWAQLFEKQEGQGAPGAQAPPRTPASKNAPLAQPPASSSTTAATASRIMTESSSNPTLPLQMANPNFGKRDRLLDRTRTKDGAGNLSPSMMTSSSTPNMSNDHLSRFSPIESLELASLLINQDGSMQSHSTLIIDIRPSTSFAMARIRNSVNVCAPSTLLKRVGVTVERIEDEMLASEEDANRFRAWRLGKRKDGEHASTQNSTSAQDHRAKDETEGEGDKNGIDRIVVLDTDTRSVGDAGKPCAGGGGPCLTGMLRKFDLAGFAGKLCWLVGGFSEFSQRVESMVRNNEAPRSMSDLVDRSKHSDDTTKATPQKSITSSLQADPGRHTSLPSFRFDALRKPDNNRTYSLVHPKGLPREAFCLSTTTTRKTPWEDNADNSVANDSPGEGQSTSAANPFYDTIRQNRELQHGIVEKIPMNVPSMKGGEAQRLPGFLRRIVSMGDEERTSALSQAFFDIEVAERDRLMATMQQHSKTSAVTNAATDGASISKELQLSSPYSSVHSEDGRKTPRQPNEGGTEQFDTQSDAVNFPFSISAAIERGSENRYNNIWTYEHSRVRCPDPTQFFNGSFVEPGKRFGCKRRYIATQAPLPSTFETFWSVLWAQDVRTICMVTREFESGRVQSHNYWRSMRYGSFELESAEEICLDSTGQPVEQTDDAAESQTSYFGSYDTGSEKKRRDSEKEKAIICRRFWLKNETGQRRLMTQLHYVAWPDYSVPENASSLLSFMRHANRFQHQADLEMQASEGHSVGPLVVHCSAGVGRTGTYITIDSVLDIIRRARTVDQSPLATWDDGFAQDGQNVRGRSLSSDSGSSLFENDASIARRRTLKRELSPSPMQVDESRHDNRNGMEAGGRRERHVSSHLSSPTRATATRSSDARDIDSPPPARRSRSDDVPDEPPSSSNGVNGNGNANGNANGSSSSFSLQFPFGSAANSNDGTQTPSTALGRLSLSTPQPTPPRSRLAAQLDEKLEQHHGRNAGAPDSISGKIASTMHNATSLLPGHTTPRAQLDSTPTRGSDNGKGGRSHGGDIDWDTLPPAKAASEALERLTDLVRDVVETIREQRMSMVQTARQYVFAYSAVLEGALYELRHTVDLAL